MEYPANALCEVAAWLRHDGGVDGMHPPAGCGEDVRWIGKPCRWIQPDEATRDPSVISKHTPVVTP